MNFTTKIAKRTKILGVAILSLAAGVAAQTPPPTSPPQNPPAGAQPAQPGQRGGGRGGGRGPVLPAMTLTTTAWPDSGRIPTKHTQVGAEASPPLAWSEVPEGVASFVLVVRDLDATSASQTGAMTDVLHWLVWNIPGTARSLAEGLPAVAELPDGSRQISGTGPYYRGPGALASGPVHHYLFELYALDTKLEVPAVGASPLDTRAAVMAGMAGHLRGKATLVGLFKRGG